MAENNSSSSSNTSSSSSSSENLIITKFPYNDINSPEDFKRIISKVIEQRVKVTSKPERSIDSFSKPIIQVLLSGSFEINASSTPTVSVA